MILSRRPLFDYELSTQNDCWFVDVVVFVTASVSRNGNIDGADNDKDEKVIPECTDSTSFKDE